MPWTAEQSAAATFLSTHEFAWKPRNEWADNAAKHISEHGVGTRPYAQLQEQAKILRESGHHDQAKILEDHHAAETARLAAEKAAQPQPVQAPPRQLQSLTPVPAYVSPLDPKGRKRAVTSFYMHPHAKPLLEAHSVNVPGLDKKEAFRRAEAAYEAYHSQQAQSQPQQQVQPQPSAASSEQPQVSQGYKNTQMKDGKPRFKDMGRIMKGLGLVPAPHAPEPDFQAAFRPVSETAVAEREGEMREAVRRQNSGSPEAKKAAQHDSAVRSGRSIPAKYVDAVMKNLNDHGYYQSANTLLYLKNTGSKSITDDSQQTPQPQPVAAPTEAKPVEQQQQVVAQQPTQPQVRIGPRRMTANERRAMYEAEKLANEGPQDAITPKFGYSSHTAPPSRFQQLIAAAKAGKLKEHIEGGLGNFFDKFERHGNRLLNRIGVDTGDRQFSRSQMAAVEFLLTSEFARIKPSDRQRGFVFDDKPATKSKGWEPPVVESKLKQRKLGWEEDKHPRESAAHDNKRPGEFAPAQNPDTKQDSSVTPPAEPSPATAIDEQLPPPASSETGEPVESKDTPRGVPDAFDPETHGGYKPLLKLGSDIEAGKLSADEFKAQYAFWRSHADEFIADLSKRFNATELKNIAANFGSYSAKTNTKEQNAKSVYSSLMIHVFHVNSSGMFSYSMDGPMAALDKHVESVTDDTFKKVKSENEAKEAKKSEEEAATQEGIKNPQTLEDYRNVIRHYGGYANLPEGMQARFDEFHSNRRREESAKTKAKVTGFSGGTEATGTTSIVEGHHQKKNAPTYTVTIENHLGDDWDDVLARARQLGGNYVNGRVARMYRATPGFQFFSKADAEKFQKTLGGEEVDRSDRLDERNIAKMDNASERLSALAEATKRRAEEKLNAPRQTNTERRAEAAASAASTARSEIAKAETMQRIAEGLSKGELKHLGGIRSRTHVDALDKMLHIAKYTAWHDAKDNSQGSYDEMKERDATSADIAKAKYPYPRIWDHNLNEHLKELSETPGLKNLARTIGKSTNKSPYKKKIGGVEISGGEAKTAAQLSDFSGISHFVGDKAIRIHATHDPKLLKGRHTVAYTADGGKSWGTTQDIAVSAAMANAVHGKNHIDLIDPPSHEQIEIRDPETISNLQKAIKILKRKSNPRLKRVAESLGMHMEDYNRLQAMDITTPQELRAALREYAPLKKKQDKEDPVKAAERKLVGRKIEGFFPTPRPAIDKMLAAADIQPGMSVLEPSAGKGDILDAVKESHPEAKSVGIEPHSDLRELIGMKGHEVHEDRDFLEHKGQYDRIVMNPPFENRQDVAHVRHAFEQLKPGGRLVAIMGAGVFGGSSKKDQEFRDWLDEQGGEVEDMPEGSFNGADAFRKTGVNTRMVVIDKPNHQQFSRDLANAYESFTGQAAVISA